MKLNLIDYTFLDEQNREYQIIQNIHHVITNPHSPKNLYQELLSTKFERKMYFPESWAGKRGEELAKITGVPDAVFCHDNRFLAVTKSKEGAVKLAQLAIESGNKVL